MLQAAVSGFFMSLSLIAAIGAQNAFVLRQGLRCEHVWPVVALCAGSDAILMSVGVLGFGELTLAAPWFGQLVLWAGVAFLVVYGGLRFRAAFRGGEALRPADAAPASLSKVLLSCFLITWANPHVYLDTVVLIGSISAQFSEWRQAFLFGAVLSSLSFFTALGLGARYLAPVMARPKAWVVLEFCVGVVMWAIAASLMMRSL